MSLVELLKGAELLPEKFIALLLENLPNVAGGACRLKGF